MAKPSVCVLALMIALAVAAGGCKEESRQDIMADGAKLMHEGNAKGAVVVFKTFLEKHPEDTEARFELAKAYLEAEKPDQAEKEVARLASSPNPPAYLPLVLGKIKLAQAKPDEALEQLKAFASANQQSGEAWEFIGRAYAAKRDLPKAAEAFERSLAVNPARTKAKISLIEVRLALSQPTQAEGLLNDLLAAEPKNQAGLHLMAQLQVQDKNIDGALATYATIIGYYPKDVRARYNSAFLTMSHKGASPAVEQAAASLVKEFPNQPEGYKLQGMLDYNRGAYSQAVTNFQQALKLRPQLENHFLLAMAFERTGNLEMAISELRVVLDNAPRFVKARQMMASLNLRLNRVDEAVAELEKLLQFAPNNALGRRMLGDIYMGKDDLNKSLDMYASIGDDSDQSVVAHLRKGVIEVGKGMNSAAEEDLRKAVDLAGDKLEPRVVLASYLARQQRLDEALAVLDIPGQSPRDTALAYNAKANILMQQGRLDEAQAVLEKAKELDPELIVTSSNLARLFLQTKRPDQAQEQYRQIIARDPANAPARTALAAILEKTGKLDEAQAQLQQALESKQLVAYLNLASFLARRNKPDAAVQVLDQCLLAHGDSLPALISKVRILSATGDQAKCLATIKQIEGINPEVALSERFNFELASKNWDEAEKQAAKFIEAKPDFAGSYLPLASVKEQRGDAPAAAEILRGALEKEKNNTPVRLKLGSLYMGMGKFKEARTYFDNVIATDPGNAMAYASRGLASQLSGDTDAAAADYETALSHQQALPLALNNLALIYAEKPERAAKALEHALAAFALDGNNPAILDTLGYVMLKNGRAGDAVTVLKRAASLAPKDQGIADHLKMATAAQK